MLKLTGDLFVATEVKEKITKFKEEKIGSRRRDFVETVKTEDGEAGVESSEALASSAPGDAMDTSQ